MADFDCIVVGAGPAGSAAAITLAKAGVSVALLERGEYPGAKNVQGAVLYSKMLAEIVPDFWLGDSAAPLERPITEQRIAICTEDSWITAAYKSEKFLPGNGAGGGPANCYTFLRVPFDRWFAGKAEEAGATLVCGTKVAELLKENGRIVGVKADNGDELRAHCVIACDGANSLLAQKAGLHREWKPEELAIGAKEILQLDAATIEARFNLEKGEGATLEMFGRITKGMPGYAFLYTNKETLSLGVGCTAAAFMKSKIPPYELLEAIKSHPLVRRLIAGAKPVEYSAHLIPEGGFRAMPPLFADGFLVCGDAAQMVNPPHREGSNLAMASGRLAAETVIEAKKKGDYSARTLSLYKKKIKDSFIWPDLYDNRNLGKVEKNPRFFTAWPEVLCEAAHLYFTVDGRPKRAHKRDILRLPGRRIGWFRAFRDLLMLRHVG